MIEKIEEKKIKYSADVRVELERRGIAKKDIEKVISKTGFTAALNEYPEEQMHYSVQDAVSEILLVAASY